MGTGPFSSVSESGAPTPTPPYDFWGELSGGGHDPAYRSLAGLGERSEAVVVGSFTGEVESGRELCDVESLAGGPTRGEACVAFVNLPLRIDALLAGSLPEEHRETVRIEYQVDRGRQQALAEAVPSGDRIVLFIQSGDPWRRAGVQDVFYAVGSGNGTFRVVDGRVVPLVLVDDPHFGRLDGMPFEAFVEVVGSIRILDLQPEG